METLMGVAAGKSLSTEMDLLGRQQDETNLHPNMANQEAQIIQGKSPRTTKVIN